MLLIQPTCALAATADEYDGPTTYDYITVRHYVAADTSAVHFIVTIPDEIIITDTPQVYNAHIEAYNLRYLYCIAGQVTTANGLKLINADTGTSLAYEFWAPFMTYSFTGVWLGEQQDLRYFTTNTDNVARHTDSFQMSAELADGVAVEDLLPGV